MSREILKKWMELWRLADGAFTAFLRRWKLSLNAYFVLVWLKENPEGVEPAQLADAVNVQRRLIAIILRDFDSRRLILRRECASDHRRRLIQLSKKGRAFAEEVCGAVDALDMRGLAVFTKREQAQLLDFSRRFYEAVREGK